MTKGFLRAGLAMALSAALFGCAPRSEVTEVEIQRFFGECNAEYGAVSRTSEAEGECGIMTALVNEFNAANPDVRVRVNIVPWPGYYQLSAQLAAGDPPDLVTMHISSIPDYQVRGLPRSACRCRLTCSASSRSRTLSATRWLQPSPARRASTRRSPTPSTA